MAGGIIQLVAYGPQDMYLTNNPQITFFKVVYRRHTNFSMQQFEIPVNNPLFGYSSYIEIHRLGDLISQIYLKITIPPYKPNTGKFAWVHRLGHAIVNNIKIEIGESKIDKHTGLWLDIWYELTKKWKNDENYMKNIGDVNVMTSLNSNQKPLYDLYIPLKFWFNMYIGLALPLISIQYHKIKLTITFENINNLVVYDSKYNVNDLENIKIRSSSFLINYIYLDDIERKKYATYDNDYLIEQLQYIDDINVISNLIREKINFVNPVKELIWCVINGHFISQKKFLCYSNNSWNDALYYAALNIMQNSIQLLQSAIFGVNDIGEQTLISPGISPPNPDVWYEIVANSNGYTPNGLIYVVNESPSLSLYINTKSVTFGNVNYIDKIKCTIHVSNNNTISINNLSSSLTIEDISIPTNYLNDTRINSDDITVNMFSNYGIYVNGEVNPILYASLENNSQERFKKRKGNFYNYLHPEMHHTSIPKDGINVYSFSVKPELHQPSGTCNFSTIENIFLNLQVMDNVINDKSKLCIFVKSYNILRISYGLAALSY